MTTRLYCTQAGFAAAVTPSSWSAGWNKTTGVAADQQLLLRKVVAGADEPASVSNTASGTSGHFTALFRNVSPPLLAQTLSGTIKGQFKCFEAAAGDNFTLAVAVKVIKADGTDRGVLVAVSASDDTSTTPPEFSAVSLTNRALRDSSENASISLSSLAVSAGDRIVVEVGIRQASTSTNNGTIERGARFDYTDLAEDDTTTVGSRIPWVELSQDVLFQPTYAGSAATPEDAAGATGTADPTAVTPPTGMVSGDLVCMVGQQRATGATLAISNNGGQSWTSETAIGITNQTDRLFWCVYDGTWDADPSVDFSATTCNSVQMHVFRPPSASYTWSVNQALAETEDATSPYANPGQTTTGTDSTLSLVGWFTADDNSWDAPSGTGWEQTGTAQYRNTSGSDQSASYAHYIQATGGATGAVSKTQNTITGDACTTFCISFAAAAPVAFIAARPLVIGQATNRASTY